MAAHIEHPVRKITRYGRIREVPEKCADGVKGIVPVAASRLEVRSGLSTCYLIINFQDLCKQWREVEAGGRRRERGGGGRID